MILENFENYNLIENFVCNHEFAPYIDFQSLVKIILANDCGTVLYNEKEYAIFIDGGKYFNNNIDFSKIYKKCDKKILNQLLSIIKKNEINICPTTYFVITNIEFTSWLDKNSLIYLMLKSHPHYNFIAATKTLYDDEMIESINDEHIYHFVSNDGYEFEAENRHYDFIERHQIIDTPYYTYTIVRYPELLEVFDDDRQPDIPMILPVGNPLQENPLFKGKEIMVTLEGFEEVTNSKSHIYFKSKIGSCVKACLYKHVSFDDFFDLESSLDLLNVYDCLRPYRLPASPDDDLPDFAYVDEEKTCVDYQALFFYSFNDEEYCCVSELECFKKRRSDKENIYEDRMVSDIYTVIPIKYDSLEKLRERKVKENNFVVNNLVTGLNFQENFEFGHENYVIQKFHERVEIFDLGTVNILLTEEPHYNYYRKSGIEFIYDKGVPVRLIAIVDIHTHSGVLNVVNLGVKYHPTKYLDEISRNNIIFAPSEEDKKYGFNPRHVITQEFEDEDKVETVTFEYMSLYPFMKEKFGLKMVATPRSMILSPFLNDCDKNNPREVKQYKEIKASLLYCRALYTDKEELGKLVDKGLDKIFANEFGDAVYDYAVINQSNVAVLQYDRTYKDYIVERIDFAVVSLFYLELLQIESSAINLANNAVSEFIAGYEIENSPGGKDKKAVDPSIVFDTIDSLQEEYTKTLDFWNVCGNYHTTNIAYQSMRQAFSIDSEKNRFEKNRLAIQKIYASKEKSASDRKQSISNILMLIFSLTTVYEAVIATLADDKFSIFKFLFDNVIMLLQKMTYLGFAVTIIVIKILIEILKVLKKKYYIKKNEK